MFEHLGCMNYLVFEPTFDEVGNCDGFYIRDGHLPSVPATDLERTCDKHVPREVHQELGNWRPHRENLNMWKQVLDTGIATRQPFTFPDGRSIDQVIFKVSESRIGLVFAERTTDGTTCQQICHLLRTKASTSFVMSLLSLLQNELSSEP